MYVVVPLLLLLLHLLLLFLYIRIFESAWILSLCTFQAFLRLCIMANDGIEQT
jgi:hypothetical protein